MRFAHEVRSVYTCCFEFYFLVSEMFFSCFLEFFDALFACGCSLVIELGEFVIGGW